MLSRKDTSDQAASSFEEDKRLARFFASDKVRRKVQPDSGGSVE